MCTISLLFNIVPDYPVVVGANRDEWMSRPGLPPSEVVPGVWAGRDPRAQGTWMGVSARGRVAAIANRPTDAPLRQDARSRGLLCLDALATAQRGELVSLLRRDVERRIYNGFNLLVADRDWALTATHAAGVIEFVELRPGVHVIGNAHPGTQEEAKVRRALDRLSPPHDLAAAWQMLRAVCADHGQNAAGGDAVCVHRENYATLSSSLVAIHATDMAGSCYLYADGNPCEAEYRDYSELFCL